jgi:UDP-N-acetylmuramyl tripeptide synthase
MRDGVAVLAGKACAGLIRASRLGAATTLPGRVAGRLSPRLLERRAAALPEGVVVVSGTNGKTTTASMIHAIVQAHGGTAVWNRSGANLASGVVTAFVQAPRHARGAILEVDEAALPDVVRRVRPRLLVLTNVFRDQLDRYGEPERVAGLLGRAAASLPAEATVVANADDPVLWHAVAGRRPVGFGVRLPTDPARTRDASPGADAEPLTCPRCGNPLTASRPTIAHLGPAECAGCGWRSARPDVVATVVARAGLRAVVFRVGGGIVTLPAGGLHNVYDAAAALAAARSLGVPTTTAIAALERFRPRFGRAEEFVVDGRRLWLGLIKNPAGAGAVLRAVASDREVGAVVVAVNDLDADGRDVSWIWDADFDHLRDLDVPVVAGGRRAEEVALRLKYAGVRPLGPVHDPLDALRAATAGCAGGRSVVVLATYTAMLQTRAALLHDRASRVEDAA